MSVTSDLEEKYNFKIETLSDEEKASYFSMLREVQKVQMTPERLRVYIVAMRDAVERELINEPEFIRVFIFKFENRKQILLKARLQNYLLLESFLISPERAKQQLEELIAFSVGKKMS